MSNLNKLQSANSLRDVALVLGYQPKSLAYIIYKYPKSALYTKFEIPKRSGGTRTIYAPCDSLKLLQRRLCNVLQDCVDEIDGDTQSTLSHGFKPGLSIVTNAAVHKRRRFVLNVDLKNFFETINFGRVRGFFQKNNKFSLDSNVATIIAQIACNNNFLAQGAPSSPIISNLIANLLDIRLAALAKRHGCTYSRYADDLTISTNKKVFPQALASQSVEEGAEAGTSLLKAVNSCGFELNEAKTRLQYRESRQQVTGLVVNAKVNIRSEYRRKARAMSHRLFTTGAFQHVSVSSAAIGPPHTSSIAGTFDELNGMLGFINYIDRYNASRGGQLNHQALATKEGEYRKFLFFKDFYANNKPVIICEGKTDNIYIKAAIKRLHGTYPELATKNVNGSVDLSVKIHRYTDTNAGRIMKLTGGTGPLAQFIGKYSSACADFTAPMGRFPVIVLVDNDSGASAVYSAVKQVTKSLPDGTANFYHIVGNLYLVPTPGKPTKIEDFFEPSVLGTILNGKKFDPGNDGDTTTTYGKKIFAEHVVAKEQGTMNFDGFKPILDRIVAVIKKH